MAKWSYGRIVGKPETWLPRENVKGPHSPLKLLNQLLSESIMVKRKNYRSTRKYNGKYYRWGKYLDGYKYGNLINLRKAGLVEGKGKGPWTITEWGKLIAKWPTLTDKELFPYMFERTELVKAIKKGQKELKKKWYKVTISRVISKSEQAIIQTDKEITPEDLRRVRKWKVVGTNPNDINIVNIEEVPKPKRKKYSHWG